MQSLSWVNLKRNINEMDKSSGIFNIRIDNEELIQNIIKYEQNEIKQKYKSINQKPHIAARYSRHIQHWQ